MEDRTAVQKQIVDSLLNPCHGLLNLAPRVGKTKITIDLIKREKPKKILWVTPNTELRDVDIPAEFVKWRALTYLKKTEIICYPSLSKMEGEFETIILDEYQDLTENNALPLLNGKIKYKNIIALSGKHPRHKEKADLYARLGLKILVAMSIDEAVEKKLIAPYKITVIECELDRVNRNVKAGSKAKPFFNTEEAQYAYFSRIITQKIESFTPVPKFYYLNRMRFIYNLKSKNEFAKKLVKKLSGRTLIFTGGIKQAEALSNYTYHSKRDNRDLERFKALEIDELACVNAGGVGHTFKGVDNFVIVQVNSDMKGDATQKIARSLVLQEGYTANIYIICTKGTSDEQWKNQVMQGFKKENVKHISYKSYE